MSTAAPTINELAKRGPGRPRRASELDSRDLRPETVPSRTVKLPGVEESVDDVDRQNVIRVAKELREKELEEAAFNEDPIKIRIAKSNEKYASKTTELIAINGVKAELLGPKGWLQVGYLPRGVEIITKRKYVEVIAMAHIENVTLDAIERKEPDKNDPEFTKTWTLPFQVVEDRNQPKGAEWLSRLLSRQM